ncbi:uncharacterized protein LOC109717956 [Ananas comosus]|uniref:Uncharacterized protein LOC109717956 n=1 Tax=Ananas comosus TaxID=4615 RepID=A0A6P5FV27_ANACO|nr:uncharacterized protein LOC109717956 [Ananas comosus]
MVHGIGIQKKKGKGLIDQEIEETDNVPTDNDTPSPMTPALALLGPSSSTPSSSSSRVRLRRLEDIYNEADVIDSENLLCLHLNEEPLTVEEALQKDVWRTAINEEIRAIEKNKTWKLTSLPIGHKASRVRWIYKIKHSADGQIIQYKAQLVAKGYKQEKGVDYEEVFAPVARFDTVRLILAIVAYHGWQVHQMDVKLAFLIS